LKWKFIKKYINLAALIDDDESEKKIQLFAMGSQFL